MYVLTKLLVIILLKRALINAITNSRARTFFPSLLFLQEVYTLSPVTTQ